MDDLLREAIADAKSVRETALANAKIALEEAFTPRLQSMLSKKIQSEMESDEEMDKEEEMDSEEGMHDKEEGMHDKEEMRNSEEEMDKDEMRGDSEEGMHDSEEGMHDKEEGMHDKEEEMDSEEGMHDSEEGMHDKEEEMDEMRGDKDEEDSEEEMREMRGDKDEEDSEEMREEDSEEEMEEDELDLESVLAELEKDLDDEDSEEMRETEDKDEEDKVDEADYSDKEGKVGSGDGHEVVKETATDASSEIGSGDNKLYEPQNDSSKIGAQGPEGEGSDKAAGTELGDHEIVKEDEDAEENDLDLDEVLRALTEEDKEEEDAEENEKLKKEIKEHRKVIHFMRSKLNEVNLLNAKLLFSNKLFRAFGLNNNQKLKVVETFDRTKNLREVKLVYATLAESFKRPGKLSESVKKGSSSKPVASTKPNKEVLSEGAELKARFKKLANIL